MMESDSLSQRMYLCKLTSCAQPICQCMLDILELRKLSNLFHEIIIGTHFDATSPSLSRLVPLVNKPNFTLPNQRDFSNPFPLLSVPGKKSLRTLSLNFPSQTNLMPFWLLSITLQNMLTSYQLTHSYRQKDVQNYSKTMSGKIMVCRGRSFLIEDHNLQHASRSP